MLRYHPSNNKMEAFIRFQWCNLTKTLARLYCLLAVLGYSFLAKLFSQHDITSSCNHVISDIIMS